MKRFLAVARLAILVFGGAMTMVSDGRAQGLSLADSIIADPVTGAALLGFDPVAYFIENRAVRGDRERQTTYAGKVWYFASNANKSAFQADPDTYLPAFGGYDPAAIASGIAVSGSPELFVIENTRVFLFRSAEARDAFLSDPDILQTAEHHWPKVMRDMVP